MGDSDRRTSQYAHVAADIIGGKQQQQQQQQQDQLEQQYGARQFEDREEDLHDDLLDTEFHGGDEDDDHKGCYGSDHDEMLHEGFGRETEDETETTQTHYDTTALSEEGYGSHREESYLHSAQQQQLQPEHEVDLHPLKNQVSAMLFPSRSGTSDMHRSSNRH